MPILEVKNLNLGFNCECGFRQALYDVSFSLEKGKTHALVGESGCGKTISAMSILQLLPKTAKITSGTICFNGQNLLDISKKDLVKIRGAKIALIPQDPMTSLNPLYTVGNQLLEVIKIHQNLDGKEAYKKAVEAFEMVQIPCAESRLNSYPHEFSGGMLQRVIIASAIACKSKIIIADEPTTALDVTVQAQIIELLKEIRRDFKTSFIFISHDFALVYEFADTVAVMYAGHVVEKSSAGELFKNPKHPYTKALLKTLPDFNTTKLEPIEGMPPTIKDKIKGCPFSPRCKSKLPVCDVEKPLTYEVQNSSVYCHLYK